MNSTEAYAAYLAAIEAERAAIVFVYATDDAEPFSQEAFDAAYEQWKQAQQNVDFKRVTWYAALGREHATQVPA